MNSFSLLVVVVSWVAAAVQADLEFCDHWPCSCDEVENCQVCNTYSGCSQCEGGYFKKSWNHQCAGCKETFGDECLGCADFIGCQQCGSGATLTKDYSLGLQTCVPGPSSSNTGPQETSTTEEPSTTEERTISTTEDDGDSGDDEPCCQIVNGVGHQDGPNNVVLVENGTVDADTCCDLCHATDGCEGWVWTSADFEGGILCMLHTAPGDFSSPHPGCIAGNPIRDENC